MEDLCARPWVSNASVWNWDGVVRADVRVALDVGLVEALQARRRGRVRACHVGLG